MYWYNPKTQTSESVAAPCDDEQAIRMRAGHTDSATFVSEYADLRYSGMQIETALTTVGHEFRLRQHEFLPVSQAGHHRLKKPRPRASGYELLLAMRAREEGRGRGME